ncbi:MAG: N-acetyltransferase [Pseudomonadota bacterium]
MELRQATEEDWPRIWPIFRSIVREGDTYTYDPAISEEAALGIWMSAPRRTYICTDGADTLGTFYIKTNQGGGGAHVCNCGYMVGKEARGKGLARKMCLHSQDVARELGYRAMQFNFVVSSNQAAVHLWEDLGFETVGRLPQAFEHPEHGLVDALVMYKWLG